MCVFNKTISDTKDHLLQGFCAHMNEQMNDQMHKMWLTIIHEHKKV